MSTQSVKRLSQLEIDEVSLVDRPANQHGLVTITKRDEGTGMAFYDQQGQPVDEEQLQSGDVVFDEQGEPIQLFSDEDLQALLETGELTEEDLVEEQELVGVGKSGGAAAVHGGASTLFQAGRKTANRALDSAKLGFSHGRGRNPGRSGGNERAQRAGAHFGRNAERYAVGAAAGTTGAAYGRIKKSEASLGEQVLSDLSKALTDGDRDQVISKAMERVSKAEQDARDAIAKAEQLQDAAEFAQYCEVAKSFELPVENDELGELLQAVSKSLSDSQIDLFERILHTASAAVAAELQELGSSGTSPLMGYVGEVAQEVVGKSDGGLTEAQATVALFQANPDAYLEYLSENQR